MIPGPIIMVDFRRPPSARAASRKLAGPYHWTPAEPGKGRGFYSSCADALEMDPAGSTLRLRLEDAAAHLRGSRLARITGYNVDPLDDGDTLTPIVARLPSRRGFLAGWTMGAGMLGTLDATIHEDAEEAARAAHDLAEWDAEQEQDSRQIEQQAEGVSP